MDRRKPKNSTSKIIIEIAVIAVVALLMIVLAVVLFYKPWLDDEVPWTTPPTETTVTPGPGVVTPPPPDFVRNQDVTNFLVLGRDRVANLTDAIMLVQFNTKEHSINILQIPRDTYAYHESSYHKINGLYSHYMVLNDYKVKDSMEDVVEYVQNNFNVKIDYYVLMNLDAFVQIVDLIGGVEIDVPDDMHYEDEYQDLYIDIKKGKQVLNGEKAEQFVRFRSGWVSADAGRVDAQKLFLSAFVKQFKEKISVGMIDDIVNQVFKNITTNLSAADIVYYAKEALSLDVSKTKFVSIPNGDARENVDSGQWYVILNRAATLDAINKYFNVYNKDIDDSIFDANKVLTNADKEHINSFYIATGHSASVTFMDDVISAGIDSQ